MKAYRFILVRLIFPLSAFRSNSRKRFSRLDLGLQCLKASFMNENSFDSFPSRITFSTRTSCSLA